MTLGGILQSIIAAVGANQHLAYALVFMLACSESLPVLGSIIPGTTIIIAIAALVPSGAVDLDWLLGSAIAGAIVGDGFSYWLGYHFHSEITSRWPFSRHPQLLASGQAAIQRHGGKSVFIARFVPAIRAVVPLVAGIMRLNPWRFYVVNIVSAVAWAVSHIVPAVIAGASLAVASAVGGRLVVLVLVLVVVLWLILIVVRQVIRRGVPWIASRIGRLWAWARAHDNWVSREILSLLDPAHREVKGLALLVALLAAGTWVFFGVIRSVIAGAPLVRADGAVFNFMEGLRTLWGDRAMVGLTELGDAAVTGTVTVAVALWLGARRAWRAAGYWLGAIAMAGLVAVAIQLVLRLPRSLLTLAGGESFGLPSTHMAVTATVYGFLALIAGWELEARRRIVLAMATALLISLIALARLYLGANTVSDVVAGLALGLVWIAGLGITYLSHGPRPVGASGLLAAAAAAMVGAGALHAAGSFQADVHRYAVRSVALRMTATGWWEGGWATLPARRIDLGGGLEEPITLQWAGSLQDLKRNLLAKGWRMPPSWTVASALAWLEPGVSIDDLPVLTRLNDGRPARLILIKPAAESPDRSSRLILRVWRSNVELEDGPQGPYRLWLGAVVEQHFVRLGSLLTFAVATRDENAPRARLEADFAPFQVVSRTAAPDAWGWTGWVLLGHDSSLALSTREKGVEP